MLIITERPLISKGLPLLFQDILDQTKWNYWLLNEIDVSVQIVQLHEITVNFLIKWPLMRSARCMHLQMHLQNVCSNKLSLLNIGQFIAGCFKFMKSQWIEILAIEEIRQNKLLKNIFPLKYNIIIELSPLTYSIGCSRKIKVYLYETCRRK